ncbi:MAG: phosphatase PAP2 family protein [Intestinimonas sp.]|jgi:undecaprenyl-diphosphatase|nr:phosphatase PAP2 family protein [Intestinimonas sp.]
MPAFIEYADHTVLLMIQNHLHTPFLDLFFTFYTQLGNLGFLWIAVSLLLLFHAKTRRAGLLALFSMAVGLIGANLILKHLFSRPRPWLVVDGLTPLIAPPDPNSFPSGHTCAAFAAAGAWWKTFSNWKIKSFFVALAILMGFSRLYVGIHFPSDVLAGALIGLFSSQIAWILYRRAQQREVKLP